MNPVLIYQSEDGRAKLNVSLEDQAVCLNQKQLTELFGKAKGTISEHIKHIFEDGELDAGSVVRNLRTTAADEKSCEVSFYNLDMVLALGIRMRSPVAVRFRQWADKLKEYIVKGFVLDDSASRTRRSAMATSTRPQPRRPRCPQPHRPPGPRCRLQPVPRYTTLTRRVSWSPPMENHGFRITIPPTPQDTPTDLLNGYAHDSNRSGKNNLLK